MPTYITAAQVAHLPSLQYLQAHSPATRHLIAWLKSFPEHVEVKSSSPRENEQIRLSRGLQVDNNAVYRQHHLTRTTLPLIPPNLTSLSVDGLGSIFPRPPRGSRADPKLVQSPFVLPPTLTIANCAIDALPRLPDSITHLEFGRMTSLTADAPTLKLPKQLKVLKIRELHVTDYFDNYDDEELTINVDWPENLTHLELASSTWNENEEFAKSLPESVTKLSLFASATHIREDVLRRLKQLDIKEFHEMTDRDIEILSRDMETLHVNYCPEITCEGLQNLPPKLTSLIMGEQNPTLFSTSLGILPRTLTYLDVGCTTDISPDQLKLLPPTLRVLVWGKCEKFSADHASSLPTSLNELFLEKVVDVSGPVFAALPRNLQVLKIPSVEKIDFGSLADLPSSLTNLDVLRLESVQSTELEALLQNTKLKKLAIAHASITSIKSALLLSSVPSLQAMDMRLWKLHGNTESNKNQRNFAVVLPHAQSGSLKGTFAIPSDFGRYPVFDF